MKRIDYFATTIVAAICIWIVSMVPALGDTKFIAIYDAVVDGEIHRIIDTSPFDSSAACDLSAEVAIDRKRVVPWNVKPERIDVTCVEMEWPEL